MWVHPGGGFLGALRSKPTMLSKRPANRRITAEPILPLDPENQDDTTCFLHGYSFLPFEHLIRASLPTGWPATQIRFYVGDLLSSISGGARTL